jgi:hypothetical protein
MIPYPLASEKGYAKSDFPHPPNASMIRGYLIPHIWIIFILQIIVILKELKFKRKIDCQIRNKKVLEYK